MRRARGEAPGLTSRESVRTRPPLAYDNRRCRFTISFVNSGKAHLITKSISLRKPALACRQGNGSPAVHFSSQTAEWETPQWFFETLHQEFGFSLDPCSTHSNAKCRKHFTRAEDGLKKSWADEVVFMNPPYGREIALWMSKADSPAHDERATLICMVPARTDTHGWHRYAMKHEIRLLRGRLQFGGSANAAPFRCAIVVMQQTVFKLTFICPL